MLKSINKTKVHHLRFKMVLDTKGIDYAYPVNRMPADMLQHDVKMGRRGRRGDILHDPKALKGWFGHIKNQLKDKAAELTHDFVEDVALAWMYRKVPTGWTHPSRQMEPKMVESDAKRDNRLLTYESWRKLNKGKYKTPQERAAIKAEYLRSIKVIPDKEIQVPVRSDDRAVRYAQMRYDKYMIEHNTVSRQGYVQSPAIVIEYPNKIIRGMFEITGLLRGK